jgi:hypothetical protein
VVWPFLYLPFSTSTALGAATAIILAEGADPTAWTWQAYLLANLAGLVALSFWLGSYVTRLKRMESDTKELERKFDDYKEDLRRMRAAYHHVSGYLQGKDSAWREYDIDAPRTGPRGE